MPDKPSADDIAKFHRYFAIEYNNRAWDLSIKDRTDDEDEEMLSVAHASARHWQAVGNEGNVMSACMLLAEVHALLGLGETAMKYANRMQAYFLAQDTPDWEIAFTHTIHAHAAHSNRDESAYDESYALARNALDAIADDQDRAIVEDTFKHVPDSF